MSGAGTYAQLYIVVLAALLTTTGVTISLVLATAGFNGIILLLALNVGLPATVLNDSLEMRFACHLVILLLSAVTMMYSNLTSRNLYQNLVNSDRKFRALFEKSSDAVFLLGLDYTVIEANSNAARILGYDTGDLTGLAFKELVPPEDRAGLRERFELARLGEVLDYSQNRFMSRSGDQIVMEVNLALVRGDNGKPLHYQSTARDITAKVNQDRQLQTALATMAVRANTDYLTGILNRDAVLQHADAEWARFKREGRSLSILLIDMDRLKFINDTYGHGVGDEALKRLVDSLDKNRRPYDWLGRYGGDEFMVVLPGTTLTIAQEIARRMFIAVREKKVSTNDGDIPLSCSIGVASTSMIGKAPATVMELIKIADDALYANKGHTKRTE
jgi:diguanylate cyclase (GGDEF)-like protein/PAS domain S-box-containing protein